MAIANFFDKTSLAASQILRGFKYDTFVEHVSAYRIGVFVDDSSASWQGRCCAELTVDLLSRLYPKIAVVGSGEAGANLAASLVNRAISINPNIDIGDDLTKCEYVIAASSSAPKTSGPCFYVGSDNWIVKFSSASPRSFGSSINPFGAGVAACFGAANVFRGVFADQLSSPDLDSEWQFSLLDFEKGSSPANSLLPQAVDLTGLNLVGLGAVGNAALWALSRTTCLSGEIAVIDSEVIELTNLQRYVLTDQKSIEKPKTLLAEQALAHTSIKVRPHSLRWGEYLARSNNFVLDFVAVALDTSKDRCGVQASLPRKIVNAYTGAGDPGSAGVSRHRFIGEDACLMCLYLPSGARKSEDVLVSEALGMPEAFREIRDMLYLGTPVTKDFIERVALAKQLNFEALSRFENQPLRKFYIEAVCGGVILSNGSKPDDGRTEVPMVFQSALAGVMLAAEIAIHFSKLRATEPRTITEFDMLRALPDTFSINRRKDPAGNCICQDPFYIRQFHTKYKIPYPA